jgi:hypothetical protein
MWCTILGDPHVTPFGGGVCSFVGLGVYPLMHFGTGLSSSISGSIAGVAALGALGLANVESYHCAGNSTTGFNGSSVVGLAMRIGGDTVVVHPDGVSVNGCAHTCAT